MSVFCDKTSLFFSHFILDKTKRHKRKAFYKLKLYYLQHPSLQKTNAVLQEQIRNRALVYLPAGTGDSLLFLGMYQALTKKYGPLFLILKSSHSVIADMYGIKPYITVQNDKELLALPFIQKKYLNAIRLQDIGINQITQQELFIAHPAYSNQTNISLKRGQNFMLWTKKFLGLSSKISWLEPRYMPTLKKNHPLLSSTVLLCPESGSSPSGIDFSMPFWVKLSHFIQQQGYTCIQNIKSEKSKYKIPDIPCIHVSLKTLIAMGFQCAKIISSRSGYCDLMHKMGNKLYIIYPADKIFWQECRVSQLYQSPDIHEYIYSPKILSVIQHDF